MRGLILFVGGGIETMPGIRRARQLGFRVAVSDRNPSAPCMLAADHPLLADTYDVRATVAAAAALHARRAIKGVLCLATDVPVTVASVAEALGLPGIPLRAARLAADKIMMKNRFQADQVPVPPFRQITKAADIACAGRDWGWPLVLKPADSRGARGVFRLFAAADFARFYAQAKSFSPSGRVLVEKFLDGPQLSTESLVLDSVCHSPGFSDRNYALLERYAPHIIEDGGELPSALPAATLDEVRTVVAQAARSMGIVNGVVKGDIVVHAGRPFVIEMAARLSGGYFCSHEIPLNTGVDFVGAAIRQAAGEKLCPAELKPRFQHGVAQRYLFPAPGRVSRILGADLVGNWPGIALLELRVRPGDLIPPITDHPARAGVVIATGPSAREAAALAEEAVRSIKIETKT